jgi:hypothetical protein
LFGGDRSVWLAALLVAAVVLNTQVALATIVGNSVVAESLTTERISELRSGYAWFNEEPVRVLQAYQNWTFKAQA